MYKNQISEKHERDPKGRVNMPRVQHKRSGPAQFISVAVTALALALVVTGLLLHFSMQNNAENLAKIESMERNSAPTIVRHTDPTPQSECTEPDCLPETKSIPDAEEQFSDAEDIELTQQMRVTSSSQAPSHAPAPDQDIPEDQISPAQSQNTLEATL